MSSRLTSSIKRAAVGLLLIAAAGSIGYWLAPSNEPEVHRPTEIQQTLAARSVTHLDSLGTPDTVSSGSSPEDLIRRELDRRVTIPVLDDLTLSGVTIERMTGSSRVPVLIYENGGDPVVVYVYNYALLDEHPGRLHLRAELLEQLEEENAFVAEDYEDHVVVLWRNRDDIFAAVTTGNPDSLMERIRPEG